MLRIVKKNLNTQGYFFNHAIWKINIGSAGFNPDKSWFATDINTLDVTNASDWVKILLFRKIHNIMAEHVWEHLNDEQTQLANINCYRFLKKGGVLRLAVPDGFHPDPSYIEHVRPGGSGAGADDHKVLYNYKIMTERLASVGFEVELKEYWDEHGVFRSVNWSTEQGDIRRSSRNDKRNTGGELNYTSLIVDAIKR